MHDADLYARLLTPARDVAHYGHLYREKYEQGVAKGERTRRYALLPPDDVLQFAAVAVLSGIIGNASWEIVKAVAKRAAARYAAIGAAPSRASIDDDLLDRLTRHCRNFLEGLSGMEDPVRAAVAEEVIVHAITDYLMRHPEYRPVMGDTVDIRPLTEILPELLPKALAELRSRPRPSPEEYAGLWDKLPTA